MLKNTLLSVVLAVAFMIPAANTTSAQGPIITGGLVNVTVVDLVDLTVRDVNVNVNAAVQIAVNICDTTVALIVADLQDGSAFCKTATQSVTIGPIQQE